MAKRTESGYHKETEVGTGKGWARGLFVMFYF